MPGLPAGGVMAYKAKSLVQGFRIGLKNSDYYVGVPAQTWSYKGVMVEYGKDKRWFNPEAVQQEQEFNDKFGRGKYKLRYVLWRRDDS